MVLPADQQQIYREKVSKLQLETLHATETKPTLMPEFLLPPQTIPVLLCLYKQSKTPMSQRLPGQESRSRERVRPHGGASSRDAACPPLHAHAV